LGWSATLEECRLINGDLARVQTKYSGRFVGLAQAPVLEGKEALAEIERSIRILGLKGVTITSQIKGVSLDSPELYGFYEKVCELDVPVFVHPALAPIGYDLLQDYNLPRGTRTGSRSHRRDHTAYRWRDPGPVPEAETGHRAFRRRDCGCQGPASRLVKVMKRRL
jgi:predicted TIM-barrel fold metal-dependent hydrolase